MIIHREYQQRSAEWAMAHIGIPTASEFGQLVDSKWARREGGPWKSYVAQKLAEKWQQHPLPGIGSFHTEQGQLLEDEAIPYWELEHQAKIEQVGFITTDLGDIGCSPDGLVLDQGFGLEIKCPAAHTMVRWLIAGKVPKEHLPQVHGCLLVTGLPQWRFLAYRRGFPALEIIVNRDEEILDSLRFVLEEFAAEFEVGWKKLCDANGGPPPKREPYRHPSAADPNWLNEPQAETSADVPIP